MSVGTRLMTTEELLALPDNGYRRELIRGELREEPMTTRSAAHCLAMTNLAGLLWGWLREQPRPRGRLYTGDARLRLRRDPDTFVGVDLLYITAEQAARSPVEAKFLDEPPLLVVEILSPSDTTKDVVEKVVEYLANGVALVWVVDPYLRAVTVHRPDARPVLFNDEQALTAEPHLPGFRADVADVFAL
jgi:Uma2 family endonuclease